MRDVDELLDGLRDMALDPRLEGMAPAVLTGVAAVRAKAMGRRSLMLTSMLALGAGIVTSVAPRHRAQAEQIVLLNAVPSIAPSSLLLGAY